MKSDHKIIRGIYGQWPGFLGGLFIALIAWLFLSNLSSPIKYQDQYQLTINTHIPQVTAEGAGYYDEGDEVIPLISQEELIVDGIKRKFVSWDIKPPITMTKDRVVNAIWKTRYYLEIESLYGDVKGEGWYDEGTEAESTMGPVIVEENGVKHIFTGSSENSPIIMNSSKKIIADWKTQYLLTVNSYYDTAQYSIWYDEGYEAYPSVSNGIVQENGTRHTHTGWSLNLPIIMDYPKTVDAEWKTEYYLTINSDYGRFSEDNWYNKGEEVNLGYHVLKIEVSNGIRKEHVGWSSESPVLMDRANTVTAIWNTLYKLNVTVEPEHAAEVEPRGWYKEDEIVPLNVRVAPGWKLVSISETLPILMDRAQKTSL